MWSIAFTAAALAGPPTEIAFQRLLSDAEAKYVLEKAVETSVASFPWVLRPIARSKLGEVARACPGYTFRWDEREFRVHCTDSRPFVWKIGVADRWTDDQGVAHPVMLTRTGDQFLLSLTGDDGKKTWLYDFSAPEALVVTQTVESPQLQTPMRWSLRYRRR